MEQDTETYQEHIEKLLAVYRASMDAHLIELEKAIAMDAIPIYTRWQQLVATIRAFEAVVHQTKKSFIFLDHRHNFKSAKEN